MRLGKISPAYGHCQPTIDIFCGATALANVSKILCVNVSKILCVKLIKTRNQRLCPRCPFLRQAGGQLKWGVG